MDPATGINATVGAASTITGIYETIKKTGAAVHEQKIKNLANEKILFADSDREIISSIEKGDCEGIVKAKDFKKLMKDLFRRNPEQQVKLGGKVQKCYEMAKKSRKR
ncbi:MAG TPA: hypothetical protein VLE96_05495 [Chlamydiales bacterium]|nr:hypothetical protein [Chlamydiales bacterium]